MNQNVLPRPGALTTATLPRANPARVFATWSDVETKAQWFIGPHERWTPVKRERPSSRCAGGERWA
ncbi:hypothetical protein MXAN_0495 [Myxococcus xanthus DK 1622]|uniref:Polyketide cyclase n=1 Tax=Myxococcus xanthus (strain DK1622) TaxID=246197 RepID=Q1DF08_MYXXD|nr:hypothetical protein MXAN_0495 [Myxococcus xanthus DK 1622]